MQPPFTLRRKLPPHSAHVHQNRCKYYVTWMDTAMHDDMGSLGRTLHIDLPRDWANLALYRDVWKGVVSRC